MKTQRDEIRQILPGPLLQSKLAISEPGDIYEQEADRVADLVMHMPETVEGDVIGIQPQLQGESVRLQRVAGLGSRMEDLRVEAEDGEDKIPMRPALNEAENGLLQQKSLFTGSSSNSVSDRTGARIRRTLAGGQALPHATRSFFERRFGRDFTGVRVHTDSSSASIASDLRARAFTLGEDIAFAQGQYSPETTEGRKLVAHELTHVVQQRGGAKSGDTIRLQRGPDVSLRGSHTFFIGTSSNSRALAMQIAQQPGQQRVSLRVAAGPQTRGLSNPAVAARTMSLSIHAGTDLSPRIIRETENELPAVGHERVIELELSPAADVPTVIIILHYSRSRQWVAFPSGAFGVWRRTLVESAWLQATDGYHQMTVNFSSEIPGAFHSSRFRPWRHPGLGLGFLDTQGRFYPYPRGRPSDVDLMMTRLFIHMLPVVGPLVMIGEALVGRNIWGRRISTFERAVLGGAAMLSVIGPVLRAGVRATRLVNATNNLSRVGGIGRLRALQMIRGARTLTSVERARLESLAAKIRSGQALTQAEQTATNRILGKLAEPQRIAAARAEAAALTGTASQAGRYTDLAATTSPVENRVGQALARDLNADVVRVAESTAQGTRVGDYVINSRTAELYAPTTGTLRNLLSQAASKHKQAGILVIDMTRTSLSQAEVIGSAGRLFGRPEFADVSRIIYTHGNSVMRTVVRPATATGSATGRTLIRGAGSAVGQQPPEGIE